MSLANDATLTMPVQPAYSGGGNGMWGDNGAWWLLVLFALFANGGFGYGNGGFGGSGGQGALTRGDLCQDMSFQDVKDGVAANGATMQAGFRNIDNAICTLGYNQAQLANGIQMQVSNEFRGLDNAICTIGYQTNQGFSGLASQIQQCCCDAKTDAMQTRYEAAQNNCATLQAIDKVGDRIIDYLAADKAQALRDENQALRLAASQAAQNQYLVNQLRPCPQPAYLTCNPFTGQTYTGYNGGCGGCGCGA